MTMNCSWFQKVRKYSTIDFDKEIFDYSGYKQSDYKIPEWDENYKPPAHREKILKEYKKQEA